MYDVIKNKRVSTTTRLADGDHIQEVLGTGASCVLLGHE